MFQFSNPVSFWKYMQILSMMQKTFPLVLIFLILWDGMKIWLGYIHLSTNKLHSRFHQIYHGTCNQTENIYALPDQLYNRNFETVTKLFSKLIKIAPKFFYWFINFINHFVRIHYLNIDNNEMHYLWVVYV